MITFHFHLLPQYKYELFHIIFALIYIVNVVAFPVVLLHSKVNILRVLSEREYYFWRSIGLFTKVKRHNRKMFCATRRVDHRFLWPTTFEQESPPQQRVSQQTFHCCEAGNTYQVKICAVSLLHFYPVLMMMYYPKFFCRYFNRIN